MLDEDYHIPILNANRALKDGRYYHTATPLSGGRVLVAGGWYGVSLERSELYRPSTISAILSLFLLE